MTGADRRVAAGSGSRRVATLALALGLVLAGCSSNLSPSHTPRGSRETPAGASPTAASSTLSGDAGWSVLIQDIQSTPDTPGFVQLDANMLLLWSGPGLTLAPDIAAVVTGETGENFPLDPNTDAEFPTWVPPGYAIQAEVVGPYPTRIQQPVLDIYSSEGTPFHEALIPLAGAPQPTAAPVPPMPAVEGSPTMEVTGLGKVTPGRLTVAGSTTGKPQVFGRGTPTVRFGGDDDYLDIAVALSLDADSGSTVFLDSFQFQLFDDAWNVQTADIDAAPGQDTDQVLAGAQGNMALLFETDPDVTGLRVLSVGPSDSGPPSASSLAGYDKARIADGERLFDQLLTALLDHLDACRRDASGGAASVVDAKVKVAAATSDTTAFIRSRDDYADRSGTSAGTADDVYTLSAGDKGWTVDGATGGSGDLKPC